MLTGKQLVGLTLCSRYDTQCLKVDGRERRASTTYVPVSVDGTEG